MRLFSILAFLVVLLPSPALAEPPRSTAVAVTVEALSPLGGAGCFYRHRYVSGAITMAGSLISGGLMLYALQHRDRDATIVNAAAYGVMRTVGITAAALPAQSPGARPPVGLAYAFSF